jgi:hypothetical protein
MLHVQRNPNSRILLRIFVCGMVTGVGALDAVFSFPSEFRGLWEGVPAENVLGPWSNVLRFSISQAPNGDTYMGDNILYDVPSVDTFNSSTASGWQRFYVEGTGPTAGLLWYCGDIQHWFESEGFAGGAGYNDTLAPVRASLGSFPLPYWRVHTTTTYTTRRALSRWCVCLSMGKKLGHAQLRFPSPADSSVTFCTPPSIWKGDPKQFPGPIPLESCSGYDMFAH